MKNNEMLIVVASVSFIIGIGVTAGVISSYVDGEKVCPQQKACPKPTYKSDANACMSACTNNGDVKYMQTDVLCECKNGALFSGRDLRK